ncbi:chaperone modulator CbpM [Millisia brevis]|uniref:chaperone modulator CbpM n=1 Tax=Millisia brevis TaxID=264148 RepID=UPI000A0476F0|nr:chaperone modulator CbpM [Millisia brevis]
MTTDETGSRRYVLAVRTTDASGYPLVEIDAIATDSGLHPDLVVRLIALGAVEAAGGTRSAPLFPADTAARLARIVRLRRDLGLNYAGALLATDLLSRIEALEDILEGLDALPARPASPARPTSSVGIVIRRRR